MMSSVRGRVALLLLSVFAAGFVVGAAFFSPEPGVPRSFIVAFLALASFAAFTLVELIKDVRVKTDDEMFGSVESSADSSSSAA